jgi:hypothetical protein
MYNRLKAIKNRIVNYPFSIFNSTEISPLVTFRIVFGALMLIGTIRFVASGWIEKLYIEPAFFFKYYGFYWVQPLDEAGIYILFYAIIASAFCIMVGLFYRVAAITFFLTFAYAELIDATNYLNHYYLVCLFAFLLIFLPANRAFSLDVLIRPKLFRSKVPAWTIHILIFQLVVVYTFAGIAKIQSEWLFRAMPMAIWLPERSGTPILGYFFQFEETAFLFSWFGAFYDLTIAYFLLFRKCRPWAYVAVVVFHLMTFLLFNIGMFPFIMIFGTLIFFSAEWHDRLLGWFGYNAQTDEKFGTRRHGDTEIGNEFDGKFGTWRHGDTEIRRKLIASFLCVYVFVQILMPLRHWLYDGSVLWTEEGYRLSWRVMVLEKSGQAIFKIEDLDTGRKTEIINGYYLTQFQEKQMCVQPDFILQFAHFLKEEFREKHGIHNIKITIDSHVVVNGRTSRRLIDPNINLALLDWNLKKRNWILNNR